VTAELAMLMAKALDMPPDDLLNRQVRFDLEKARTTLAKRLKGVRMLNRVWRITQRVSRVVEG
jgi:plasmid maintenance system antidote protein VapI